MENANQALDLDVAIKTQREALEQLLKDQIPLDDDITIRRAYCYFKLELNATTRILKSFTLDEKKVAKKKVRCRFLCKHNTWNRC